jgi:uncharacterized protein
MGTRTSHPPGTISWADLTTNDLAAAKEFYGELLAWSFEDMPTGDGVYSMASLAGGSVAAISEASDQPPHWNVYVTVESADDTARRADEFGGTVLTEPFDVFDAGRMAVLRDPTGAILCVWQPGRNIGATLVNQPGALTWADVVTPDPDAAASFYAKLFGWSTKEIPQAMGYRVISNGGRSNGGMVPLRSHMGDMQPSWSPYFGTEDLVSAEPMVTARGGRKLLGPTPVPGGHFIAVSDPQGAVFNLWQGTYDD